MTRFRILNWWIAKKLDNLHLALAMAGISVSIAGQLAGIPSFLSGGLKFLVILTIIHFIHYNLHEFWAYLNSYESRDRVPLGQMKQVNGFFLVLFLLIFLFVVFCGMFLPWKEIGQILWQPIRALLTWLVQFLQGTKETETQEETMNGMEAMFAHLPTAPTSLIAQILEQILYLVFYVFLAVMSVRLLIWGIQQAAAYISRFRLDEDEKIFVKPESLTEELKRKKGNLWLRRPLSILDQSSSGRIRRIYRVYIQNRISDKETMPYLTPAQLEKQAGLNESQVEEEMKSAFHQIYEQARYSQTGGNRKEAEKMKEIEKALAISEKTPYNFP